MVHRKEQNDEQRDNSGKHHHTDNPSILSQHIEKKINFSQ